MSATVTEDTRSRLLRSPGKNVDVRDFTVLKAQGQAGVLFSHRPSRLLVEFVCVCVCVCVCCRESVRVVAGGVCVSLCVCVCVAEIVCVCCVLVWVCVQGGRMAYIV